MIPEFKVIPKPKGTVADMLEAKGRLVHSVGPRDTVYDAVYKMNEVKVGALLVIDGDELVGIVSERDYTRKVMLQGRASNETAVHEIMTSHLYTVTPATSLGESLHIVTRHNIRHLPVLEGGRVVGVLSIGDLVRAVLAEQAETIHNLNSFIGSDYPS